MDLQNFMPCPVICRGKVSLFIFLSSSVGFMAWFDPTSFCAYVSYQCHSPEWFGFLFVRYLLPPWGIMHKFTSLVRLFVVDYNTCTSIWFRIIGSVLTRQDKLLFRQGGPGWPQMDGNDPGTWRYCLCDRLICGFWCRDAWTGLIKGTYSRNAGTP